MSRLYFDILTTAQKKTFESLKAFSKYGLLGGGTALALQLAHRKSYDFDVFNSKPISKRFLLKVRDHFERVQILVDTSETTSVVFWKRDKVTDRKSKICILPSAFYYLLITFLF
jgi:hypothetical protein